MLKNYDTLHRYLYGIVLALFACCFVSCSDDDEATSSEYDPNKSVAITDFIPKTGGAGQKLVIYGDNFGNDTSKVDVTIGGKKAVLISCKSNVKNGKDGIYCFVPSGAFTGEIEVTVGDETMGTQTAVSPVNFNYERKMVVGRIAGYRNEFDDQGWHDGPFDECTGFAADGEMKFDPLYPKHMYIVYDNGSPGIQLMDFETETVTSVMSSSRFGTGRLRSIDFTSDGKYMIVSVDMNNAANRSNSVWIVTRNEDGSFNDNSPIGLLASYRDCNGAYIHPLTEKEKAEILATDGEITAKHDVVYFNSYENGQVFRLPLSNYFDVIESGGTWTPYAVDHISAGDGFIEQLFTIQDVGWEFKMVMHPTGKYVYFVVINQHYILRSDYDEATHRFASPYIVAGQMKHNGWADGVGTAAMFDRPYQGVFVKNEDYVNEGKSDIYDFYLADNKNHCIRVMTPEGIVRTFAGRGSRTSAADNNIWGTDNGDLREVARFRDPAGIAYDENNKMFYVLDVVGRSIRTIGMEELPESDDTENNEGGDTEGGSDTTAN